MDSWGGLIELVLVAGVVLGWGVLELVGLRLDKKRRERQASDKEDAP